MKIVYILEQFYLHGGIEKIVSSKANWLVKNGFDVTIIVNNQKNNPKIYPLMDKMNFIDLSIEYHEATSYFHPKNLFKAPKHIIKLKKHLNNIKPDVVIILSLQFDYYLLPFITRAKTIREFHSSRYFYDITRNNNKSLLKKIKFYLHDFIEQKYFYNVILNKDEKKHYKTDNVVIIPNGLELTKIDYFPTRKRKVIAAGRMAAVKNFEELIEIWKSVIIDYPDWKLEIYGGGDDNYFEKLQNLIKKLNLEDNCILFKNTNSLRSIMLESSIYAMTSTTECFPMVLLEAQHVGLPIISYDCPYGPRNIISNQLDGLLVKNQDKKDFIKQLKKLIENEDLRHLMKKNALKQTAHSNIDSVMKKWVTLFNLNQNS